jgi:predicted small lipoprotein YifL
MRRYYVVALALAAVFILVVLTGCGKGGGY